MHNTLWHVHTEPEDYVQKKIIYLFKEQLKEATKMPLKVAVVCSSNQNRSMEAHAILSKKGFNVKSFGTGATVKLPGPAADKPNIYDFKTTYEEMYQDLRRKDRDLYTQNGILHMLDRNRRIKPKPERFQSCRERFDIVLTAEERVYDQVLEDFESREEELQLPVHIINIDIQDNHEEATIGAFRMRDLCMKLESLHDLDYEIDELIQAFEHEHNISLLHTMCFY